MSAIARKLHNRANSRMVNKGNDGEGVKTENALLKSLQDRDISVGIMHTEKVWGKRFMQFLHHFLSFLF